MTIMVSLPDLRAAFPISNIFKPLDIGKDLGDAATVGAYLMDGAWAQTLLMPDAPSPALTANVLQQLTCYELAYLYCNLYRK